jgi:ubiquitin-conjugating enzyme E2 J1
MESDARGQLGGLECTAKERERLAGLSAGWRCGVCGRSNKEVIAECEERVREKGEEKIEEVEVPKELSLGYKDDMQKNFEREKKEKEDEVLRQREGGMDEDAAELAEGFVGTGNPGEEGSSSASAYPVARPAQSVPQPTSTVPQHQTAPPNPTAPARIANAYPQQAAQRRSNDGVPIWIDRAIAGIVVCLVFMVLKILLGL